MTETPKQAPAQSSRAGLKKELPEHFKAYKHVWVVVECEHGAVHPVSFELLGEGRKLADKRGVELAGVVMGSDKDAIAAVANECFEYRADLVYTVTDPALAHYRNEAYTKAMTDLVKTYKPEICCWARRRSGVILRVPSQRRYSPDLRRIVRSSRLMTKARSRRRGRPSVVRSSVQF